MKYKSILITGAEGMLGEAVMGVFGKRYEKVFGTDLTVGGGVEYLDVADIDQVAKWENHQPDLIIHLAALTDVDYCEKNADECMRVNALGTKNVALLAMKCNATMIFISSASVFDGKKEYYTEFDDTNPANVYGKSKLLGEEYVRQMVDKHFIFRAGWMIGGGVKKDKKFVNKIYQQICSGVDEILAVNDKIGSLTYTVDFAESMIRLLETGYFGTYHQVCHGSCSRYDVACELVAQLGVRVAVKGVPSSFFSKDYSTNRPAYEVLINRVAELWRVDFMRGWKECLDEYCKVFADDLKKGNEPLKR